MQRTTNDASAGNGLHHAAHQIEMYTCYVINRVPGVSSTSRARRYFVPYVRYVTKLETPLFRLFILVLMNNVLGYLTACGRIPQRQRQAPRNSFGSFDLLSQLIDLI